MCSARDARAYRTLEGCFCDRGGRRGRKPIPKTSSWYATWRICWGRGGGLARRGRRWFNLTRTPGRADRHTVRPRLYIAAGISGSVQHRAGMDKANKIIAINTDPNAPIFQIAHYKIVGDLGEVLPLLIKTLREKAK